MATNNEKKCLRDKVNALKKRIEEHENELKKPTGKVQFGDPSLVADVLSHCYADLGNIYLSINNVKEAKNAFENAKKYSLMHIKNEYNFEGGDLEITLEGAESFWNKILEKLRKGQLKTNEVNLP